MDTRHTIETEYDFYDLVEQTPSNISSQAFAIPMLLALAQKLQLKCVCITDDYDQIIGFEFESKKDEVHEKMAGSI